jgi:hypothetical protein
MKKFFLRLFSRFLDRDKDGDVDKQDALLLAKSVLERYLSPEQAKQVLEIAKILIGVVEAGKLEGVVQSSAAREVVGQLLVAAIKRMFGVSIPIRVVFLVIEALVDVLSALHEDEKAKDEASGLYNRYLDAYPDKTKLEAGDRIYKVPPPPISPVLPAWWVEPAGGGEPVPAGAEFLETVA